MTSKHEGNTRHSTPGKRRMNYDMLMAVTKPQPGFEEGRVDELRQRAASMKRPAGSANPFQPPYGAANDHRNMTVAGAQYGVPAPSLPIKQAEPP